MRRTLISLVLVGIVAGCAAIGPVSSPEFPQLVAKAIPKEDGEMHFYGSGIWHPNTRGFTGLRSIFLARPTGAIPGVLVITGTAVLFQQWDEPAQKFVVVKRLSFFEVIDVSLDTYGSNRRLVLRKKDLSYDSFNFTKLSGNVVDVNKVEEAFKFLLGQIKTPNS